MITDPELYSRAFIEKELAFSCSDNHEEAWMKAFTDRINDLILHDFNRLVLILYRLDISESKLKKLLRSQTSRDATGTAAIICRLIVERQIEKIKSRKQFGKDENISEEEKW